jgi:hypothetical protein
MSRQEFMSSYDAAMARLNSGTGLPSDSGRNNSNTNGGGSSGDDEDGDFEDGGDRRSSSSSRGGDNREAGDNAARDFVAAIFEAGMRISTPSAIADQMPANEMITM